MPVGVNTINGVLYVYEYKSIWNSEKRRSEQKREYLGKMVDGVFVPNKFFKVRLELLTLKKENGLLTKEEMPLLDELEKVFQEGGRRSTREKKAPVEPRHLVKRRKRVESEEEVGAESREEASAEKATPVPCDDGFCFFEERYDKDEVILDDEEALAVTDGQEEDVDLPIFDNDFSVRDEADKPLGNVAVSASPEDASSSEIPSMYELEEEEAPVRLFGSDEPEAVESILPLSSFSGRGAVVSKASEAEDKQEKRKERKNRRKKNDEDEDQLLLF